MSGDQLARIKRRMAAISPKMKAAARASLSASADELVRLMRRAAPEESGDLERSIVAVDQSDDGNPARFRVRAGGPLTTTDAGGRAFDYARAVEFGYRDAGGEHHPGKPFFWSSYRRMKRRIKSRLNRALKKAATE